MNRKEEFQRLKANWWSYHTPGQSNIHMLKKDALFFNANNSASHEMGKALVAYLLKRYSRAEMTEEVKNALLQLEYATEEMTKGWERKGGTFLSEAERNRGKNDPIVRVDVVLISGREPEEHEVETGKERGERHEEEKKTHNIVVHKLYDAPDMVLNKETDK